MKNASLFVETPGGGALGIVLLSQADMAERWGLRLQAVQNRKDRHKDFPTPVCFVSRGRVALYLLADVERYETARGVRG